MNRLCTAVCSLLAAGCGSSAPSPAPAAPSPAATTAAGPRYGADGALQLPADYREWVFLGSGVGMTYGPLAASLRNGPPAFDNVFVNPASYRRFLATGTWPDKTFFLLEIRGSESHAALNKQGHFQRDVIGLEAHVKDSSTSAGPWTFYVFDVTDGAPRATAAPVPRTEACYTCHEQSGAVDTTFVQFYPSLYDVAVAHNTIEPGFEPLPLTVTGLSRHIRDGGWAVGKHALDRVQAVNPKAAVLAEGSLNLLGYRLMAAGQLDAAIGVLEWVAARYPASANAQDSLADAYMAASRKDDARRASERCTLLVPADKSLDDDLKRRIAKVCRDRVDQLAR